MSSTFDPWENICSGGQAASLERYLKLFDVQLAREKKKSYQRLHSANRRDRKLRFLTDVE